MCRSISLFMVLVHLALVSHNNAEDVLPPSFTPASGHRTNDKSLVVLIHEPLEGARIYYTFDKDAPTYPQGSQWVQFTDEIKIDHPGEVTIRAVAVTGEVPSRVVSNESTAVYHVFDALKGVALGSGYAAGCSVEIHADSEGLTSAQSTHESAGETDQDGNFEVLSQGTGWLVLRPGPRCRDHSGNVPIRVPLFAPPNSTVISPISTLAAGLVKFRGLPPRTADDVTRQALALPLVFQPGGSDPIALSLSAEHALTGRR
eukprot:CAMPEP_0118943464 /NCGR_PEP_ID=MMETSP1169-20130426/38378_1 /TAXON_ID=36882 /ORGANISM="Pyramimonas obovata, Strain CCMP722" /LENGTH=258 /DNA_ID=CAMNT_0006888727 /DNA_START=67 /DNA_END=840 /DNA_ORIENTATION=-